jgi:hypothetical protein
MSKQVNPVVVRREMADLTLLADLQKELVVKLLRQVKS